METEGRAGGPGLGPWPDQHIHRGLSRRLLFRRRFLLQLPRIVAHRLRDRHRPATFVSMMGGVGDLVNFFPTLAALARIRPVEMATGGYPAAALVRNNPHVSRIFSPFLYKPHRESHRRLITRVLSPLYERVLLLELHDRNWWRAGRHISEVYAAACGCPAPQRGAVYLSQENRRKAAAWVEEAGLGGFIFVTQLVRLRRARFRSWPLRHYHALYRLLQDRVGLPVVVDTFGSEAVDVPAPCMRAPAVDIMTMAAIIERARLFIGTDSGLTHVAAALGRPTVAVHLGYPPENSGPLGDNVTLVRQRVPFSEPAETSPEEVAEAVVSALAGF